MQVLGFRIASRSEQTVMSSTPTRVLFVLPSLLRAGAETQVVDLINALDPKQFRKHLLTFEANLDQLDRLDRSQIQFSHRPRRHKFDLSAPREIARIIDEEQIDLVHCSLQIALFMGWLGIKLSKRKPPLILAVHTTVNVSHRDDWFDKYIYQWLMRACRKVIFVCHAQKAYWQAKFPFLQTMSEVIYNGVDADHFDPDKWRGAGDMLRETLTIPRDGRVTCQIAGFRPEKGHAILLGAFVEVLKEVPNAYLILAGDGPLRPAITDMARELGIEGRVRFLGSVADVRPVLAGSDVSVLSSTAVETFSIAMLESMAMQVPMVATDMGGTAEAVLQDETGKIVEPGNCGELAKALASLLKDDVKRREMGLAGRRLVQKKFTRQRMVQPTGALMERCIEGGSR